jgi:hypothetical protein
MRVKDLVYGLIVFLEGFRQMGNYFIYFFVSWRLSVDTFYCISCLNCNPKTIIKIKVSFFSIELNTNNEIIIESTLCNSFFMYY